MAAALGQASPPADRHPTIAVTPLGVFAFLWAVATLFHIGSYNQWGHSRLLVFAAVWVVLTPSSLQALSALAILQIYWAVADSPVIPNHWLFTAIINGGLLLAMLGVRLRTGGLRPDALLAAFAPAARASLVGLYALVVIHKLNTDFFTPAASCATAFYAAQAARLPFLPESPAADWVAIVAAVGLEALIPVLLLIPRTRLGGILVGFAFHGLLTLNPVDRFYNFTPMLFAMFSLFAPHAVWAGLQSIMTRTVARLRFVLLAGLAAAALVAREPWLHPWPGVDLFLWEFIAYTLALLIAFVAAVRRARPRPTVPAPLFAMAYPWLAVVPTIVVLNGLMPYVGLKTESSWAMFSSLRTEGGVSNHFIVPAGIQLFGYQRDLVQLTGSSDRYLRLLADRRQWLPYFELRRRPDAAVSYIRDGVEFRYDRVRDDPHFEGEIPVVLRKLLYFRPIDPGTVRTCLH